MSHLFLKGTLCLPHPIDSDVNSLSCPALPCHSPQLCLNTHTSPTLPGLWSLLDSWRPPVCPPLGVTRSIIHSQAQLRSFYFSTQKNPEAPHSSSFQLDSSAAALSWASFSCAAAAGSRFLHLHFLPPAGSFSFLPALPHKAPPPMQVSPLPLPKPTHSCTSFSLNALAAELGVCPSLVLDL